MRNAVGIESNAAYEAEKQYLAARERGDRAAIEVARRALLGGAPARAGGSAVADLGAILDLIREDAPKRARPGANASRDLAEIGAVLRGTGTRRGAGDRRAVLEREAFERLARSEVVLFPEDVDDLLDEAECEAIDDLAAEREGRAARARRAAVVRAIDNDDGDEVDDTGNWWA